MTIRVLLIDDHVLVREALSVLLQVRAGLKVVGEARNPSEALSIAAREKPNIILLALNLDQSDGGLNLLPELLSAAGSQARILLLTDGRDSTTHCQAARLGAMGIVLKRETSNDLLKAISKVHAGEVWLNRSLTASLITSIARNDEQTKKAQSEAAPLELLTDREREVATLAGEGLRSKEIGKRLFISEITVRHHLTSIFGKLDVSNRLGLILFLYRHKLVNHAR
jgi:two-component system, NarL family, nitrate/nitrite response regulator NarL